MFENFIEHSKEADDFIEEILSQNGNDDIKAERDSMFIPLCLDTSKNSTEVKSLVEAVYKSGFMHGMIANARKTNV